jgi:AraC-like DNA-binding protein
LTSVGYRGRSLRKIAVSDKILVIYCHKGHYAAMEIPLLTSTAYAMLYLRASQQPPGLILAGTGLTEADLISSDYVDYQQMRRIIQNIENSGAAPGWAARIGLQLHVSTHGPLGFAALSAPTLGAALEVMAAYYPVRITTLSANLERRGQRLCFNMRDETGDIRYARLTMEPTLRVIETLVETIVGHPVGDYVKIYFSWPAPDYLDVLEDTYGAPCAFDAAATSLSIPASWAHIPSPLHDERGFRANIARCREIIARLTPKSDTVAGVRNILVSHFERARAGETGGQAPPSLEALATQLHTTPRTLIRRLKRQGSSYRSLLEEARIDCAGALLQQAQLTVAEVGARVGYSDPANFGRAFRRVTGVTPAAWRRGRR